MSNTTEINFWKAIGMLIGICAIYLSRGFFYAIGAYSSLKLLGVIQ